jgi:hypothetical protein
MLHPEAPAGPSRWALRKEEPPRVLDDLGRQLLLGAAVDLRKHAERSLE